MNGEQLKFVLDNMQSMRQCPRCLTVWIMFKDGKDDCFYRLCDDPNSLCAQCVRIDALIESKSKITAEGWVYDGN